MRNPPDYQKLIMGFFFLRINYKRLEINFNHLICFIYKKFFYDKHELSTFFYYNQN